MKHKVVYEEKYETKEHDFMKIPELYIIVNKKI